MLIGTDCDDTRANVNPAAIDVCYDALDNDCNGIIDNVGQPGGCIPIVTTLGSATCGATINNLSVTIVASYIVGAQGYRFKVTNTVTNTVQIVDRPVNSFALTSLSGITYNTQYQIEVALKVFNVWQPFYGAPCYVVTPTPNSTIGAQCGTTLTSLSQWIYATSFANITSYRFRVTNLTTNQVQILDRSLNKFMMTNLTNITNNTVYRVEISLRNTNGVYLPYGTPCTISTPNVTTRITPDPISTITTTESPKEKLNSVVYPNPFSNNFNLTIENGTTENVKITIYDLTGRLIDTKTVNYSEIENLELGNDYPSGVYNLILTQGTETKSLRIVKR